LTNRDLAAADFKRYKELRDQNFISGAELERRDAALKAAQAQLDQARRTGSAQGNQAAYTTLGCRCVRRGDRRGGRGGPSRGRRHAGGAHCAGRSARCGLCGARGQGGPDQDRVGRGGAHLGRQTALRGVVREVAASADPVTRTFGVKVSLPAMDALALGTTVSVLPQALDRSGVQVIKLPTSALRQDGQASAVWVLDTASMTVKLQPIQIATADGNDVIISGGLQPGMQVVSAGVHVLSPGQKVTIYKEKGAPALVNAAQPATKEIAKPASAAASAPAVSASAASGK
jgi:multidrug efflux system membrane fusion protein